MALLLIFSILIIIYITGGIIRGEGKINSIGNVVKLNICLPIELKKEIKKISEEQNTNFSNFIRETAKERLIKIKKEKLRKELK